MNYFSQMKIFKTLIGQEIFFFFDFKKRRRTLQSDHQLRKESQSSDQPNFLKVCVPLAIAGSTYSDDVSVVEPICNSETSPNKGFGS